MLTLADGFDVTSLGPLITGAGGALVALLAIVGLFVSDKVMSSTTVERLRSADEARFNDMKEQRDVAIAALEKANATTAASTEAARQSLQLLREVAVARGKASQ